MWLVHALLLDVSASAKNKSTSTEDDRSKAGVSLSDLTRLALDQWLEEKERIGEVAKKDGVADKWIVKVKK